MIEPVITAALIGGGANIAVRAINEIVSRFVRFLGASAALVIAKTYWRDELAPEKVLSKMAQNSPYTNLTRPEAIKEQLKEVVGFINFLRDFNLFFTEQIVYLGSISPEIGIPLSQLANAYQWSYGLGWLSWIGTGEVLGRLVQKPLSKRLNLILRDRDLSRDIYEKMFAFGSIDFNRFKQAMAEEGWKDEDIEKYKIALYSELDADRVKELVRLGQISISEYKKRLMDIGIREEVANKLVKLVFKLPTLSEIRKALKNGLISEADAIDLLLLHGYSIEHARLLLSDVKAEKIEEQRDLTKSDILKAFEYGIINEVKAREFLKDLGYDNDEIDILISTTKKRIALKNIDKGRDLAKSDILNAYIKDVLTATEAKDLLRKIGYDENEANILLRIAESRKKIEPKERKRDLARSDIVKAYKTNIITKEEAMNMLKQLGYSEEESEIILKVGTYEKPKERKLTISDLRRLYNEGLLTLEEYKNALIALGFTEEDVDLLIIREKPRLTASILLDAFRAGAIDSNFIVNYAKKEGMTYQEIVFLHRNGAIDENQAKELLRKFGFNDDEIKILLRFAK